MGCKGSNRKVVRSGYDGSEEWVEKRIGWKGTKKVGRFGQNIFLRENQNAATLYWTRAGTSLFS